MSTVPHVATAMQKVLNEVAQLAGCVTEFVQRESKLSAPLFVQTLVFGWMAEPQASRTSLAQTAAALGLSISPQAIDKRLTPSAAQCLERVLMAAVEQVIAASPISGTILNKYQAVYLYDATTITLPRQLADHWQGCGGSIGVNAALKMNLCWDLITGRIIGLALMDGYQHEASNYLTKAKLPARTLRIADLGYFDFQVWQQIESAQAYWLSRYKIGVCISDLQGQEINLLKLLKKQCACELDTKILLGREKMACRLVAQRLPARVIRERHKKMQAEAQREGKAVSAQMWALAAWNIYLTNIDSELLPIAQLRVLIGVRWQIELLFKLWKSQCLIDESRSEKPWAVLCEIYAKMIAVIIQHWILLVSCWQYPDRSLFTAINTVRKMTFNFLININSTARLIRAIQRVVNCLASGCRINKRRAKPSSFQLLADTLG